MDIPILMRTAMCVSLVLAATASTAEIYSCAGPRGMTVYQNFPCEFTSRGSVPATSTADLQFPAAASAATRTATEPHSAATNPVVAKPATRGASARNTEPQPGMSEDDVRKAWGEPEEIIQDESPSGPIELWRYKDGRSVQIRRHRIVAAQL